MHLKDKFIEFIATGFFISRVPAAITGFKKFTGAGFFGTLIALGLTPLLPQDTLNYAVFLGIFFIFSIWIAGRAEIIYGTHDDPRIVIDEMLGYWIATAFMPRTIFSLTFAFIFFRIIDTLKPWPIKRVETKLSGGLGVILDDAIAGIEANILTRVLIGSL